MKRLPERIREILSKRRVRRFLTRVVSIVGALVVFATTYALVLPAITMEKQVACGIEEHQHDDSCFELQLICGEEESETHQHTDECYERVLVCEKPVHTHSTECYETFEETYEEPADTDAGTEEDTMSGQTAGTDSSETENGTEENGTEAAAADGIRDTDSTGASDENTDRDETGSEKADAKDIDPSRSGSTEDSDDSDKEFTENHKSSSSKVQADAVNPEDGTIEGESLDAAEVAVTEDKTYAGLQTTLDLAGVLLDRTGLYYYPAKYDEDGIADTAGVNSGTITDWDRVEDDTQIASADFVRVYLAYTIPAGTLNKNHYTARYRLPGALRLTDDQVEAINKNKNGVSRDRAASPGITGSSADAGLEADFPMDEETWLGAEAIEGTRTPDKTPDKNETEYISATVKVENIYKDGKFRGQDLVLTFTPYTVRKNQTTYDADGKTLTEGEKVRGFFTLDLNPDQISCDGSGTAEILFAEKNDFDDVAAGTFAQEEIRRVLHLKDHQDGTAGNNAAGNVASAEDTNDTATETDNTDKTDYTAEGNQTEENKDKETDAENTDGSDTAAEARTDGPEDEEKFLTGSVIAASGEAYEINVTYGDDAQIPDGSELRVREILENESEYKDYAEQAVEKVEEAAAQTAEENAGAGPADNAAATKTADSTGNSDGNGSEGRALPRKSNGYVRVFDIEIWHNGQKIEPSAEVLVEIRLLDAPENKETNLDVVHFAEDGPEVLRTDQNTNTQDTADTSIQFTTDAFSVYTIVGTETITTQVITESGDILQVTVEATDARDAVRFKGLRVDELNGNDEAYWTAYDAVVAEKQKNDENFDEETFGFFAADIELLDADGAPFEPEGIVNVKMELISLPADASTLTSTMEVQHLAEKDGEIDVQTVATVNDVTTVNDVITTQFDVESFSTFTLTWTGEGESEVISDDDAEAVLNIQSGSDTYATVNIHYVDEYGHNIRSPFTTSVNGTTPVTIEGLLDGEISGYEYQGAYYNTYTGEETDQAVNSIAVSRTSSQSTGTEYVSLGTATEGRINNSQTQPAGYTGFYSDANGNTQIYWITNSTWQQNNRFHIRTNNLNNQSRYAGPVYGARTGTVTNYNYTLSFDNTDIEELTNTNTSGTWEEAADIYLVYKSSGDLKHATIHFGTLNPDGSFSELEETTSLDTDAASISFGAAIAGYDCVGAYYCETASSTPADDGVDITLTLRKVEDAWQYTDTSTAAEKGFVADGSHIYVSYKEKSGSGTPTPSEGEIPTPSTIKNVTDNGDGTYDIQLDIIGQEIVHEETKGANVLLIFDRTSSMSNAMSGATNRFEAAKSAVRTLVTALNPGVNPVEMAVFSFDRNANAGVSWTTSGTAITNYTDDLTMAASGATPGSGGTNWEAAFAQAKTYLASADSDPTYVIFLTDGNPTIYVGSNSINQATATSQEYTRARAEASGLSSSLKLYGILCANQSDGPLLQTLVNDLSSAAYGSHDMTHILANDSTTLTNTFNNIAQHIVNQLGATDVSTQDGVTSLSNVSANVSGAAGAFKYYKAYQVAVDDDNNYYYVDDSGTKQIIAAADVQEYSYQDAAGNDESYLYYNREVWAEAPGASYSAESGVTWDLGAEGKLKGGNIYSVRFTVWPSQKAYDLLADLNNGLKDYDTLDPAIQNQVYQSGGVYYMKTNTTLDTTYTFGTDTYTDNIPYHQGAMDLDVEEIKLKKNWPENMLDGYGAATYRDENGVEHTATEITLTLVRDNEDYLDVTVDAEHGWQKSDVFISCGLMTVVDSVATIEEHGHDYTVTEPAGFSYYWDLIADVYHPMVINGVTTMLILDEDATIADVDNENYFNIDGEIFRKIESADGYTLEADNYRRSNLNITKVVTPNSAPDDAKFEYTVTVTDAESTDGNVWFSAWDPVAGATVKDTSWVKSGATPEAGNTGYWYATNGATVVFEIEAGWNVRFLNLKHKSTFSVEETDPGKGYSFISAEATTKYTLTDTDWYEKEGALVTGTITEPNNEYTLTYTNKWDTIDIQLKKVDENNELLSGSTFTLARQQGTAWVNIQEDIKPGDTTTSTANPVDLGGLGVGNYRLTETKAPDGYVILSNHVDFEVYKDGTELKARLATGVADATIDGPGTGETPTYTITVKNTPGQALPNTGGPGTLLYTLSGLALMLGAALMYGFRMRRRERRLN